MASFVRVGNRLVNLDNVTTVHVGANPEDPQNPNRATLDYVGGGHSGVEGPEDVGQLLDACGHGKQRKPARSEGK